MDPTSDFFFFFFGFFLNFIFAKTVELFFRFFFFWVHSGKCSLKGITTNKSIFGYCGVQALSCNAFILRLTLHLLGTNQVNHLPGPIFLKPIYSNEAHIEGYVNEEICIYIYTLFITLGMLWYMGKDH